MHAGMSYARLEELGGIQWPCPDEDHPGTQFLHARLWADDPAEQGTKAPFSVVIDDPPVDELNDEFPLRLTTGRRLDSYNTGVQIGCVHVAAAPGGDDRRLARGRGAARTRRRASWCAISSRRGTREAPVHVDPALRPGLVFMTFHFPDQVDTNVLTIEATDPKSGTAEFKATAVRIEQAAAPPCRERRASERDAEARGPPSDRGGAPPTRSATPSTALLGAPESGWHGAARDAVDAPRGPGRPRGARASATCSCPRCTRCSAASGWISEGGLNYVCERLDGPAGRGVRRRDVLRDVQRGAAADDRGARLRRHRLPGRRRRGDLRASGARRTARRSRPPRRGDATWVRSPCLGLCERAPAVLYQRGGRGRGGHGHRARRRRSRRPRWRRGARLAPAPAPVAPATGRHRDLRLLRRVGVVDPDLLRRLPRARRVPGAPPGGRARRRGHDRGDHRREAAWAAAARRSPPASSGRPSPSSPCTRTTSSATPTSRSRARSRTAS